MGQAHRKRTARTGTSWLTSQAPCTRNTAIGRPRALKTELVVHSTGRRRGDRQSEGSDRNPIGRSRDRKRSHLMGRRTEASQDACELKITDVHRGSIRLSESRGECKSRCAVTIVELGEPRAIDALDIIRSRSAAGAEDNG